MKEFFSVKRMVNVISLLLAVMMLFSACTSKNTAGNKSDLDSDVANTLTDADNPNSTVEEDTKSDNDNVSGNHSNNSGNSGGHNVGNNGGHNSGGNNVGNNSGNRGGNNPGTVGGNHNGNNGGGATVWGPDPFANIPATVKSKGVHVLMWRKYTPLEQKLVDDFQKKTGMKVRTTIATEQDYMTKTISLISGNDAPDVCALSSTGFPGIALKAMQVLDAKTFRLDDQAWYKNYMDCYKINNRYFSVAMQGAWSCEDCNFVTYYMPKVLKACGISEDPYSLYQQGKWNWDKQKEIATKIAKAGKDYIGISMQSDDLMMHSAGEDFVKLDGTKFTNALNNVGSNSLLTQAWLQVSDLTANKVISNWDLNNVKQGKAGLFTAVASGMCNETTNAWFASIPHTSADIKAVPVAGPKGKTAYIPIRLKTWGVATKAKNPEGAAYFLRYFLDTGNCDTKISFCNEQFKEVYNKITAANDKKSVLLSEGIMSYVNNYWHYHNICRRLSKVTTAEDITNILIGCKGSVNSAVKRVNKKLAEQK